MLEQEKKSGKHELIYVRKLLMRHLYTLSGMENSSEWALTCYLKCMELAIKLTLWQLFSHMFDRPMSAHLLDGNKKVKPKCTKNYDESLK